MGFRESLLEVLKSQELEVFESDILHNKIKSEPCIFVFLDSKSLEKEENNLGRKNFFFLENWKIFLISEAPDEEGFNERTQWLCFKLEKDLLNFLQTQKNENDFSVLTETSSVFSRVPSSKKGWSFYQLEISLEVRNRGPKREIEEEKMIGVKI